MIWIWIRGTNMTDTKERLLPPKRLVLGNQVGGEWPGTAYVREDVHKELKVERDTLVRAIEDYLRETGGLHKKRPE
jgi:hypothetical protein